MIEKCAVTARDWILIAVIAAVIGVFFTFMDGMYSALSNLLGPTLMCDGLRRLCAVGTFAGVSGAQARCGAHRQSVCRRHQHPDRRPYGIHIAVASLLQGLGSGSAFGLTRYERYGVGSFALSAVFVTLFVSLRDYFVCSGLGMPTPLLLATLTLRVVQHCGHQLPDLSGGRNGASQNGSLKSNQKAA